MVNNCEGCLEKQRKIDQLLEEVQRLKAKLRYQERKDKEGFFGASRALSDPNPSRIKSLVQRIISDVFLDGQLEECELTLKDLHKIEDSFTHILTAIFHQRVDYPSPSPSEASKKKNDENLDPKSAKTVPFRLRKNKKGGPNGIGRVGIS